GPLVHAKQLERGSGCMKVRGDEGAKLAAGRARATGEGLENGFFFQPTVLTNVKADMRVAQEEILGPVVSFVKVRSLEEAIAVNNATPFGLSSSIFTTNVNAAFTAMRDLSTGIVYVNHGTTGAETHLPFGGNRGTGNGHRAAGHTMLDPFSGWKSIYVDYRGRLPRAQIAN